MATTDTVSGGYLVNASGSNNMSADVTSSVMNIEGSGLIGIQIFIDNTNAVGVLYVQGSNALDDSNVTDLTNGAWTNLELPSGLTSYTVSSGTDVSEIFNLVVGCKYVRVFYDFTSGNGELYVVGHQKIRV